MECVARIIQKDGHPIYFWRTHEGAEVDLFWQKSGKNWGVEFKFMDAPRRTKSMQSAVQDLELEHLWVIYPGDQAFSLDDKITTLPLSLITEEYPFRKTGKLIGSKAKITYMEFSKRS